MTRPHRRAFGHPHAGGGGGGSRPAIDALREKLRHQVGGGRQNDEFYDAIMRAEGTAAPHKGYDEVLGYGAYGKPSKPITEMTLDEAYAFGRQIKARHGSSSALGAFQIVGRTMRAFQAEAGLTGEDKFSLENQRRLADVIMKRQGFGAWEGFKAHPGEERNAATAYRSGVAEAQASGQSQLPPNVPRPGTSYRAMPDYENFGAEHRPGAALRAQAAAHANAYASPFGPSGPVSGARTGKATLEVSLKGFPPVNTKSDGGGLFDRIELDRGRSMQQAK